jgi:hypothetical protein
MNEFYRFQKWYIPERMRGGIERYINHGIKPGSFLCAVIENNLSEAHKYADEENLQNIPAYIHYFYNECPMTCWGSKEKMEKWMESFKSGEEK